MTDQEIPTIPPIQDMDTFQNRIREWVVIDNKINNYNKKLKTLRTTRNLLSQRTTNYMEENQQQDLVINIADGKLKLFENKKRGVPSMGFLRSSLLEYFQNDEEKVQDLIMFLQQRLPITQEKGLKRYFVTKGGNEGE